MSFLRNASKTLHRQQEKLMQKVGRAEATIDEEYDQQVADFHTQQAQATRLQKEAHNYMRALKQMTVASKAFGDAMKAVYEPEWTDSEKMYSCVEHLDLMYQDLQEKVADQVVAQLGAYIERFPEIKTRISKRDRKIIDFDRCRRALETERKKAHSTKLAQAETDFKNAEQLFTEINNECHTILPSFHLGRVSFYATTLQSFFTTQGVFFAGCGETTEQLRLMMDRLAEEASQMSSQFRSAAPGTSTRSPAAAASKPSPRLPRPEVVDTSSASSPPLEPAPEPLSAADSELELNQPPSTAAPDVLEIRLAAHSYDGQDDDELTFQPGDVIYVIPFADPEEEDDGWLNGRLESGITGVFPMNFTVPKAAQ